MLNTDCHKVLQRKHAMCTKLSHQFSGEKKFSFLYMKIKLFLVGVLILSLFIKRLHLKKKKKRIKINFKICGVFL